MCQAAGLKKHAMKDTEAFKMNQRDGRSSRAESSADAEISADKKNQLRTTNKEFISILTIRVPQKPRGEPFHAKLFLDAAPRSALICTQLSIM
jgi:hypothetical protein